MRRWTRIRLSRIEQALASALRRRKKNVDVDQFVGGARQNSGYAEPPCGRDHFAPSLVGGATALVQDAVNGGGTDSSLDCNLNKSCRPLPTSSDHHRRPSASHTLPVDDKSSKSQVRANNFAPKEHVAAYPQT